MDLHLKSFDGVTKASGRGGRPKLSVWQYFNIRDTLDGKKTAQCTLCCAQVSYRADRVKSHFKRCAAQNSLLDESSGYVPLTFFVGFNFVSGSINYAKTVDWKCGKYSL